MGRYLKYTIILLISFGCIEKRSKDSLLILKLVKEEKFRGAKSHVSNLSYVPKEYLVEYIDYKQLIFSNEPIPLDENKNKISQFFQHTCHGLFWLYKIGDEENAHKNFEKALILAKQIGEEQFICESYRNIIKLYDLFSDITNDKSHLIYLGEYEKYANDEYDKIFLKLYKIRLKQRVTRIEDFKYNLNEILSLEKRIKVNGSPLLLANLKMTKASLFFYYEKNADSTVYNLNIAKSILKNSDNVEYKKLYFAALLNEIRYNRILGRLNLAKSQLDNLILDTNFYNNNDLKKFFYQRKWRLHEAINKSNSQNYKMDSSLFYKAKYLAMEAEIQYKKSRYQTASLKTEYQENKNKRLEKELKFWIFSSLTIILLAGSTSYLIIKNSRRKRLLALQEKELEKQKNITLIKEQEINTINAMVAGQEKERKQVAEDLHDNLGSVIATLKLHFDNLRINQKSKKIDQELLFDRTEGLIDDAYQKVRSIAHAKNAGVIANQGLLVAVQFMAEKISSANTIQINVIDFGLEKPLENSFEISLFRIIQELTTNIIKHAHASEATIHITQDLDDITILIEDNGIGMDSSKIHLQKGMGLYSIKTRVAHIGGSFAIDATPTKGTTVIIQVPT